MKIKIELEATPDEIQDLFVPSDKQADFAKAFAAAYVKFLRDLAATTADTINPMARRRRRQAQDAGTE